MKKKRSHLFILKKEKKNSSRNQKNIGDINTLQKSSNKKKLNKEFDKEENIDNIESSNEKEIKYKTGRWTEEEHENFLKGLIEYGNDWKMVQKKVKTRSSSQSRSHAQKYFLKIKNIVSSKNWDEKGLYNFITNTYLNCIFDFQFTKLSFSDREKLYNAIVSNIDLFDKKKSKIPNKEENISVDYCNKYDIESKSNNNSFHSDEDDEISESNEQNKRVINNKRKRSIEKNTNINNINNKIFNVVKCPKYKNTEEYNKNKKNDINIGVNINNTNNTNINNNKKIKQKFTVNIINNNENSNINNNINNTTKINNNYIINNNTINITANLKNNNTTNNIDLSNCNIFNLNINTININFINNESNKNLHSLGKPYQNTIENNNINESQKKILYDNFKFGEQSHNYFEDNQREEDDLSSINKKEKMFFISPL